MVIIPLLISRNLCNSRRLGYAMVTIWSCICTLEERKISYIFLCLTFLFSLVLSSYINLLYFLTCRVYLLCCSVFSFSRVLILKNCTTMTSIWVGAFNGAYINFFPSLFLSFSFSLLTNYHFFLFFQLFYPTFFSLPNVVLVSVNASGNWFASLCMNDFLNFHITLICLRMQMRHQWCIS